MIHSLSCVLNINCDAQNVQYPPTFIMTICVWDKHVTKQIKFEIIVQKNNHSKDRLHKALKPEIFG